jgi:hypothetical protein
MCKFGNVLANVDDFGVFLNSLKKRNITFVLLVIKGSRLNPSRKHRRIILKSNSLPATSEIIVRPSAIPSRLLVNTFEVTLHSFTITEFCLMRNFGLPLWVK